MILEEEFKKIKEANVPPHAKEFLELLLDAVEKTADYEKAQSFEEFLGYKMAKTIYKEILRKIIANYEK